MRVSFTLLVALIGLVATVTATAPRWVREDGSSAREASGSTDRETKSSTFEKLGFCNERTLKGRYNAAYSGFVGPGPVSRSVTTFYGDNGQSFKRVVQRGNTEVGPPIVINFWSSFLVNKNCSTLEEGIVFEFTSPVNVIFPADQYFVEGNVAPDGSSKVFTSFAIDQLEALSGDQVRVAKFALPPKEFINGPPDLPGCDAEQSCVKQFEGENCNTNSDCRAICFPICDMFCVRIGLAKKCVRQE